MFSNYLSFFHFSSFLLFKKNNFCFYKKKKNHQHLKKKKSLRTNSKCLFFFFSLLRASKKNASLSPFHQKISMSDLGKKKNRVFFLFFFDQQKNIYATRLCRDVSSSLRRFIFKKQKYFLQLWTTKQKKSVL